MATVGMYPLLWLYRNCPIIDKVTGYRTASNTYIIWIAVCIGVGRTFSGYSEEGLGVLAGILSVASSILYIVWAFKAKKALQEYALNEHRVNLKMNAFYTFVFNVYYINYCINGLPEEKRKQQILAG